MRRPACSTPGSGGPRPARWPRSATRRRRARGEAREAVLAQLRALDAILMSAILAALGGDVREAADAEAREALAPFRDRMDPGAYQRAHAAAVARYVRDRFAVPTIDFER